MAKIGKSFIPEKYSIWWETRTEVSVPRTIKIFPVLMKFGINPYCYGGRKCN